MRRIICVVFALAGCGTTVSSERLAAANMSIAAAQDLGADKNPNSAAPLNRARQEVKEGVRIGKNGDEGANGLLDRAQADADLAAAIVRQQSAEKKLNDSKTRLDSLSASTK